MKEQLERIFTLDYTQYKGKVTGNGEEVRQCFKEFKNELKPFVSPENLFVDWSIGQFRWAAIPWVRIYDKDISPETGSGVYIVYLFAESGQSVFVTLNQGVSKSSSMEIQEVKKKIQESIPSGDFAINHGSIAKLGDYADSTIFFKVYQKNALPSDDVIKKDLKMLIDMYKKYISIEKGEVSAPIDPTLPSSYGGPMPFQTIFFGAPGTGKSHKIDYNLFKDKDGNLIGTGIKEIPEDRKFRTTFHPDYDYAQFVGAYKPKKDGEKITYSFVPQVFAKAYAAAWKLYLQRDSRLRGNDDKNGENDSGKDIQVYLVIEEINRGNCAQIFGDIFQLLDRDEKGFSQYSIDADYDFADWLKTNEEYGLKKDWELYVKFHYEKDGKTINPVSDTKIALPPNLNILATMNTSDQSLFPMDSAFKRRFDWEYVPINYERSEADFIVGDASFNFKWLDFLKKVNADIYKVTQSEDKQMGEFFIKPKNKDYITLDEFRSKVLFYLWDTVYKDELDSKLVFHFAYPEKGPDVTFQRLFNSDFVEILKKMLANLDDKYKDGAQQE